MLKIKQKVFRSCKKIDAAKKQGQCQVEETAGSSDEKKVEGIDASKFFSENYKGCDCTELCRLLTNAKIFYCSRTHMQLYQVSTEFTKTGYHDKRMTILSSREITCIQQTDRPKRELCGELLDPSKQKGCPYYNESNKATLGTYRGLYQAGVETPWDIEDLITAGRQHNACPYFAARSLVEEAEIVFCPYNYILDPAIRESMQLDVRGAIIILDEAHNMEEVCREVGSISVTGPLLECVIKDCTEILEFARPKHLLNQVSYASAIERYCQVLRKFINTMVLRPKQGTSNSSSSNQWTGSELLALFEINNLDNETTDNFLRSAREAIRMFNVAKENFRYGKPTNVPTLTTDGVRNLEMIVMALNMISSEHAVDYRTVVKEVTVGHKQVRSLEFLCMNPNVIFGPLSKMARTIILASGTLAPTSSFASELGVEFPITVQASHVTPSNQICVKCVKSGPNGKLLRANFENVNTWQFQDEVGSVIASVCEAVPHGILVFFSSYTVMSTLVRRWELTEAMRKITKVKYVFKETRGSGNLANMMMNYRSAIRNTSDGPIDNVNGAVLFAVFRGKIAEGIDFSDNEARAVLSIGIPFSTRSEPAIDMKCRYNDANKSKGLLGGFEWYTVQAFRALNQALGRAIRHINDWGAIILIDERLTDSRYVNYLPHWIQLEIPRNESQLDLSQSLRAFVARQKKRDNKS